MATLSIEVQVGDPAPEVALATGEGVFRLEAYRGQQHVLLYFMRTFDCPVCMGHVARLARMAEQFRAQHIAVVIVGPGDAHEAEQLRGRLSLPYRLIADPERVVYLRYGLDKGLGGIQRSGSFLIDSTGVVRYAIRSTLPTGALKEPALLAAISQLTAVPSAA